MTLLEQGWFALLVSLGEAAPFVILGLVLAGLIREFIPARALENRLGGPGLSPILRAVGLGAVLPICSCSTIPLGLGMTRSGARTGTALAFMTSAPALSPVTVILGFSLLGPALLASYSTAVLCGSCLIGLIGNNLLRARGARDDSPAASGGCGCGCEHNAPTTGQRLTKVLHWSLFDLGSEVSLSLLAGLLIATILLVFTPDRWVFDLVGQPGPLAIVAVILLALPAYTCSVPALLIAASLIAKGADPGVAVAFLIAGPATNLGELNAIRVGLGFRTAGYYLVSVVLLAFAAATAIDLLPLPAASVHLAPGEETVHHKHSHLHFGDSLAESEHFRPNDAAVPVWRWPFVLCIGLLACHAIAKKIRLVAKDRKELSHVQPTMLSSAQLAAPDGHGGKI